MKKTNSILYQGSKKQSVVTITVKNTHLESSWQDGFAGDTKEISKSQVSLKDRK
jgi:hypothetical protein